MKKIRIITILFFLALPLSSLAAGLQISPARLNFTVTPGQETTQKITVANPTADVQIYEITADDFINLIKVMPKSFTLESGARKEVSITILGQESFSKTNQKATSNISVIAKPLTTDGLTVGTGAKIPLEITVINAEGSNNVNLIVIVIVLVIVITTAVIVIFRKKKKSSE